MTAHHASASAVRFAHAALPGLPYQTSYAVTDDAATYSPKCRCSIKCLVCTGDERIGARGSATVRRLTNPVTLCNGHGVFVVAANQRVMLVMILTRDRGTAAGWHCSGHEPMAMLGLSGRRWNSFGG